MITNIYSCDFVHFMSKVHKNKTITFIFSNSFTHFVSSFFDVFVIIYSTKKLRKSQKTMQHKNIKANNDSNFIYLFRYMTSVEIYLLLFASVNTFVVAQCQITQGSKSFFAKMTIEYFLINT